MWVQTSNLGSIHKENRKIIFGLLDLPVLEHLERMFGQSTGMHLCHDDVEVVVNEQTPMVYPILMWK